MTTNERKGTEVGEKKIDEGPVLSENVFQELFMNTPDDRT